MSVLKRILLLTAVSVSFIFGVYAQEPQSDTPPSPDTEPQPQQTERIVDGRPALYSFKRTINPFTWLEVLPKPLARSAENDDGVIHGLIVRKPDPNKVAGVRFGIDSAGTGSGFGPSVTFFHKNVFGKGIDVEVPLVYTYSRYELYRFSARVPLGPEKSLDRLSFDLDAGYASRPADDFFGIGNDTPFSSDVLYRTVTRRASVGFSTKLNDAWGAGLHAVYRSVGVTKPFLGHSAQEQFDNSVPGLFTGATIRSMIFSIDRDTEQRANYRFTGGTDHIEVSFNNSPGGEFAYWKYQLDSQHFIPLTSDGRKVIAVRGLVETNHANNGHLVPFFDMAWIGSSLTLRGFENFRFRDNSAMAFSLEYRYRIWPAMDFGLFTDAGQVAPQLGDFGWNRFHKGYGARLFFWPKASLPISVDYGRSRETWRLYLNMTAKF